MTELDDINIRHFKLTSGEDLIAIVLTEEEVGSENFSNDLIMVQRPMEVKIVKTDTEATFVFYDWQPLAKSENCFINPMHVISHVECANDVKEQYVGACINTPDDGDETYDEPVIRVPSSETYH
jgi:hypothetical protein